MLWLRSSDTECYVYKTAADLKSRHTRGFATLRMNHSGMESFASSDFALPSNTMIKVTAFHKLGSVPVAPKELSIELGTEHV